MEAVEVLVNELHEYPSARIFAYHERGRTFHPKIYLFEGAAKCELIIGSSNLTSQGLFTAKLIMSNEKMFKYKIVWIKSKSTNAYVYSYASLFDSLNTMLPTEVRIKLDKNKFNAFY